MTPTPVATVVITYFQPRLALLDRCLSLLRRQTVALEIIVAYDGPGPGDDPRIDLLLAMAETGGGRAPNRGLRTGFARATTNYVIHCPPEMLVPVDGVERMTAGHQPGHRDVPALFALSRETTEHLDDLPWRETLSCLKDTPDFWTTWGPLAMNNIDSQWCNWHINFCGATRDEWLRFGVLPDSDRHDMNENWLAEMEAKAGPGAHPILSPVEVYHQWHAPGHWPCPPPEPTPVQPSTVPESVRVARAKGNEA